MRDGQLGRQGIQTDQFPTATFVLTEPIEIGRIPAEGASVDVTAVGDLAMLPRRRRHLIQRERRGHVGGGPEATLARLTRART